MKSLMSSSAPFVLTPFFRRNPQYLAELTRDNVQLLFNKLFELPTEKVEETTLAVLPTPTTPLPRAKQVRVRAEAALLI